MPDIMVRLAPRLLRPILGPTSPLVEAEALAGLLWDTGILIGSCGDIRGWIVALRQQ